MTGGIGEEYDEEDDRLVFKSDVRVAKLSDDALQSWIATFLLGAPSLGAWAVQHDYSTVRMIDTRDC